MSKSKKIYQYTLEGKLVKPWDSISDAAKVMGCNESSIRRAITKGRNSCNFYWLTEETKHQYNYVTKDRTEDATKKIENLIKYGTEYTPKDVAFKYDSKDKELKEIPVVKQEGPKILLLDVETAPIKGYVWRLWQQDVNLPQLISDWFMLTWSAKWLGDKEILSTKVSPEEVTKEEDKRIVEALWYLLDEADVVIAHNGNRFDIPKINSRFIVNGLQPPSSYKQVDTKIIAKNNFGFSSNKLEHLANTFGIEGKYDTDFELWVKCLAGDEKALEYMEIYNRHDVEVLEQVYLKLRPYAKGHANLDLFYNDSTPHCPTCGSTKLSIVPDKSFYTQAVKYQLYRCECGALSRAKQADKFEFKKKISAIPR